MLNSLTKIKIKSNSPNRIINQFLTSNINLIQLVKLNAKEFYCKVNDKDLKKIQKFENKDFEVEVSELGGISRLKKVLIYRIGLIIGLIISLASIIALNGRLLNIQISGLNLINRKEIEESINEFGIGYLSKLDFNHDDLSNYLLDKHNLALVSIGTKGNTLLINIKEKETRDVDNYEEIIAPYNMVIKKINVYSGSTTLKEGDVVYKGDTLIYPYDVVDNEKISVNPCADIEAEVFVGEKYIFNNEEKVTVKTGNSKTINLEYLLGNWKIFSNEYANDFKLYEKEELEEYLTNELLPLKIKKTVVFELKEEIVNRDFENEKNKIIEELKNKIYKDLDKKLVVDDEIINISQIETGYIINVYVKSVISLNYKD